MKRLMIVPLLAILAACGTSPVVTESNPITYSDDPTLSPDMVDAVYLAVLSTEPSLDGISDDVLLEVGDNVCAAFDNGATLEQIFAQAMESNVPTTTAGTIIGAAVPSYCPEYQDQLDVFIEEH